MILRNKALKYRPTPLNIACGTAIGVAIYAAIRPGPEGWGYLMTLYLVPYILSGLIIDFMFQKFLQRYLLTFTFEAIILSTVYFCYSLEERTKTLIIPDKLQSHFIVLIYGVDNSAKLPDTWNYSVKVPSNGILLTSSTFESDLPETKMKTYSGIELNTDKTELGWARITSDKFECQGKTFDYQFWMVDSSCCVYSNHQIDSIKVIIKRQFCGQLTKYNL